MAKTYTKNGDCFRWFSGRLIQINGKNKGVNEQILTKTFNLVEQMINRHNKTFAYMFIPLTKATTDNSEVMSKFIGYVKVALPKRYQLTTLACIWVKEHGKKESNEHYHVCLMADGNKLHLQSGTELKSLVISLWVKAGGQDWENIAGVQLRPFGIMDNDLYHFTRGDTEAQDAFLYRLSYIAKVYTKATDGSRTFGVSNKIDISPPKQRSKNKHK